MAERAPIPEHTWSYDWTIDDPHRFFSTTTQEAIFEHSPDDAPRGIPNDVVMAMRRLFIMAGLGDTPNRLVRVRVSGYVKDGEAHSDIHVELVTPVAQGPDSM